MLVVEKGMESLLIWEKELPYHLLERNQQKPVQSQGTNKWLPSPESATGSRSEDSGYMVSKLVFVARTAVQACPLDTSIEHRRPTLCQAQRYRWDAEQGTFVKMKPNGKDSQREALRDAARLGV